MNNRLCLPLLTSLAVWFAGGDIQAATYYLAPTGSNDTGDGSRQKPWKTIRFATEKMPDDGSNLVLLDGLYEGIQWVVRHFNTLCTIRAENPYRARLRSPAQLNRALYCYDTSYVRFQGLEIFGSGAGQGEYVVHVATPKTHHIVFDDCIIHDSYDKGLVKVNDFVHHIVFRGCIFFNEADNTGSSELLDVNTVSDVRVEDCIFFNDFRGSGRPLPTRCSSFVVVKNSGSRTEVTRRIAFRRNIFLNWEGRQDETFLMLGEDGKPFFEAQEVMIENNLFIHNSPIQSWGTLLYKGGLKDITFRANTVVGHPAVQWTGAMSVVCCNIEKNPPMGDLILANNIWCDPTGGMPRFSISDAKTFAPGSKQLLLNNLYWNAGKKIPTGPKDVLTPERDVKGIVGDPRLGSGEGERGTKAVDGGTWDVDHGKAVLPRWDLKKGAFLSGRKTIREEFERLVRSYAVPAPGSPAIHAADPSNMPKDDILGHARGAKPDIGCYQSGVAQ